MPTEQYDMSCPAASLLVAPSSPTSPDPHTEHAPSPLAATDISIPERLSSRQATSPNQSDSTPSPPMPPPPPPPQQPRKQLSAAQLLTALPQLSSLWQSSPKDDSHSAALADLMPTVTDLILKHMPTFEAKHLRTMPALIVTLSNLSYCSPQLVLKVAEVVKPHLDKVPAGEVVDMLAAFSTIHTRPSPAWLGSCMAALQPRLPALRGPQLVTALWALSRLGVKPTSSWLGEFLRCARGEMHGLGARDVSRLAWACAEIQLQPGEEWTRVGGRAQVSGGPDAHMRHTRGASVAQRRAPAPAGTGQCGMPVILVSESQRILPLLESHEMSDLAHGLLHLKPAVSQLWTDKMLQVVHRQLSAYRPSDLTTVVSCCVGLGARPGVQWTTALLRAVGEMLPRFSQRDLPQPMTSSSASGAQIRSMPATAVRSLSRVADSSMPATAVRSLSRVADSSMPASAVRPLSRVADSSMPATTVRSLSRVADCSMPASAVRPLPPVAASSMPATAMLWAVGALQPITPPPDVLTHTPAGHVTTAAAAAGDNSRPGGTPSPAASSAPAGDTRRGPDAGSAGAGAGAHGVAGAAGIFASPAFQSRALTALRAKILAHAEPLLGRLSGPGLALLGAGVVQAGLTPSRAWMGKYAGERGPVNGGRGGGRGGGGGGGRGGGRAGGGGREGGRGGGPVNGRREGGRGGGRGGGGGGGREASASSKAFVLAPSDLTRIISALASLHYQPSAALLDSLLTQSGTKLTLFTPSEMSQTLAALASFGFRPSDPWMASFLATSAPQLMRSKGAGVPSAATPPANTRTAPGAAAAAGPAAERTARLPLSRLPTAAPAAAPAAAQAAAEPSTQAAGRAHVVAATAVQAAVAGQEAQSAAAGAVPAHHQSEPPPQQQQQQELLATPSQAPHPSFTMGEPPSGAAAAAAVSTVSILLLQPRLKAHTPLASSPIRTEDPPLPLHLRQRRVAGHVTPAPPTPSFCPPQPAHRNRPPHPPHLHRHLTSPLPTLPPPHAAPRTFHLPPLPPHPSQPSPPLQPRPPPSPALQHRQPSHPPLPLVLLLRRQQTAPHPSPSSPPPPSNMTSPPATIGSTPDPAGLAEIVVALAKLGVRPTPAWTSSYLAAVSVALPRFDAAALGGVVWGVAMLELPLPAGWWEAVLARLEQQQALDSRATAPDPQEEAEKGWKRLKYKLVGNPKLGLQHLADAEQQDILDERLKARLSKFWGLMCEADRPWQRRVIVHLAVELPPPACYRYQQLKPSSMQQVISERAQVEKQCWAHHEELSWHMRQLQRWYSQARRGGPAVSRHRLGQTRYELTQLRAAVRTSLGALQGLMDAAGNLADDDYVQYALARVEPLLVHLEELCALTRDGGVRGVDALCRGLDGGGGAARASEEGAGGSRGGGSDQGPAADQDPGCGGRGGDGGWQARRSGGRGGDGVGGGRGSGDGGRGGVGLRSRAPVGQAPSHLLPLPELRSPDTVRWRYPPQAFVEVRRKGLRGGGLHTLAEARGVWGAAGADAHGQLRSPQAAISVAATRGSVGGGYGERERGLFQPLSGDGGVTSDGGVGVDGGVTSDGVDGDVNRVGGGVFLEGEDEQLMVQMMGRSPPPRSHTGPHRQALRDGWAGSEAWREVADAFPGTLPRVARVVRKGMFDA
ncbi:MAG: hypothetical protein WDW36_000205 [Sanguina aurantia]